MPSLRIATRSSALALWQANEIARQVRQVEPDCDVTLVQISTTGDQNQVNTLASFGGMGVFTREVQKAVLDGRADLAVHSLKDLPTEAVPGLTLAAVPPREETADALIVRSESPVLSLNDLPPEARLGSGSLRRRAQLWHVRPDLELAEIRGNVDTRLRKLDEGEFEGIILAAAGLKRLGLADRIRMRLEPPLMFAAIGQGALGLECRADDDGTRAVLQKLEDPVSRGRVVAERRLLAELRAGCHAPVGAETRLVSGELELTAVVLSLDGRERLIASKRSLPGDADALGSSVAADLLQQGAQRLMNSA